MEGGLIIFARRCETRRFSIWYRSAIFQLYGMAYAKTIRRNLRKCPYHKRNTEYVTNVLKGYEEGGRFVIQNIQYGTEKRPTRASAWKVVLRRCVFRRFLSGFFLGRNFGIPDYETVVRPAGRYREIHPLSGRAKWCF